MRCHVWRTAALKRRMLPKPAASAISFTVDIGDNETVAIALVPCEDVEVSPEGVISLLDDDENGEADTTGDVDNAFIDTVNGVNVDDDTVVERLIARGQESGRSDDTEETIRHRLHVYAEQTTPLVEVYEGRGVLRRVDGMASIDEVSAALTAALQG